MLFRIDCLMMLPEPVDRDLLKDLQTKCILVFESHNLSTDKHLTKTLHSKLEKTAQKLRASGSSANKSRFRLPAQSPSNSPNQRRPSPDKEKPRSSSKGFIIKKAYIKSSFKTPKEATEDLRDQSRDKQLHKLQQSLDFKKIMSKKDVGQMNLKKSANNFFILGRKKSFADLSETSELHMEESFGKEKSKPRLVSFGKKELKNAPTPKLSPQLTSVKKEAIKDYSDGLLNFLKLGRTLKDQVKTLEVEYKRDHKVTLLPPNNIFDDASAEVRSSEVDLQIKHNFDSLMKAQQEWELRTTLIQERLERLERCSLEKDRQTNAEESNSVLPSITSKRCSNGSSAPDPDGCNTSDSKSPINLNPSNLAHLPQQSRLKHKSRTPSNHNLKIELSKIASKTPQPARLSSSIRQLKTPSTDLHSLNTEFTHRPDTSHDAFMSAFKLAVDRFEKGLDRFEQVRKIIQGLDGVLYVLTFSRETGDDAQVAIDVSRPEEKEDSQKRAASLARKILNMEQLRFLFLQIHLAESLPCHLPASSFTSLSQFLSLVLSKYIRVDSAGMPVQPTAETSTKLSILKTQMNILQCDKPVLVDGTEVDLSLVHVHGYTFRMLLRPHSPDEELEAVQVEVVFNDWVLNQFFHQYSGSEFPDIQGKLARGERLTEDESERLRRSHHLNRDAIWLIDTVEKKVALDHQNKLTQVLLLLAKSFEDYLACIETKLEAVRKSASFYLIKLVDWKQDRYTVFEIPDGLKSEHRAFTIRARNNFKSYSNCSPPSPDTESLIEETAKFAAKEAAVRELFAVDYAALEASEKRFVWYCFIRRSSIEVIEEMKGVPLNEFLGDQKMQEKDALFKKCLSLAKMDIPSSRRLLLGSRYKSPVTFQTVAIGGELMGLAVKTYTAQSCCEAAGVFLLFLNPLENVQVKKLLQSKKRSHFSLADYRDKFGLLALLEAGGYLQLASELVALDSGDLPSFKKPLLSEQASQQMLPLHAFLDPLDLVCKQSPEPGRSSPP